MKKASQGFTLIELVMVIVILGVLAAVALPKFVNLKDDARLAVLNGLAGTLQSAASIGRARCAMTPTCDMAASACGGTTPFYTENGKKIFTHFGWPSGWGACWVNNGVGSINDLVQLSSDFQLVAHIPNSFAGVYQLVGSPDPTNCKVIYQLNSTQPTLAVTVVSTGC
jgi:MSHA pilin protein MshA